MGTDVTQERQHAHALLDMLPQEKLTAVRSLLEVMVEPLFNTSIRYGVFGRPKAENAYEHTSPRLNTLCSLSELA
jgi:hypothetical protein